jgi:hypothetical protein
LLVRFSLPPVRFERVYVRIPIASHGTYGGSPSRSL